jgi:hypothetical protein
MQVVVLAYQVAVAEEVRGQWVLRVLEALRGQVVLELAPL